MLKTAAEAVLARFTLEHQRGEATILPSELLRGLRDAVDISESGYHQRERTGLPGPKDVELSDVIAGLRLLPDERALIDKLELDLIHAAIDRGANLTSLAAEYAVSPQAFGKRYRTLGGTRDLKPGRPGYTVTKFWVAREFADLDQPGPRRGEVTLHRPLPGKAGSVSAVVTGGGFRTVEPSAAESVVFLGQLPEPGKTAEGHVHAWGHEKPDVITKTRVYVRAENIPLEPK